MNVVLLQIAIIRRDGGTQPRAQLDPTAVAEYAEAMLAGEQLPPVTVFHDGADYWLADGFHRVKAAEQAGLAEIAVDVRQGDRRAAILFSTGVNAEHGLRRTNADKRRAVDVLMRDPQWSQWSDREIARQCKVGHPLVAEMRKAITGISSSYNASTSRTYTDRHGAERTMNTAPIAAANAERAVTVGHDALCAGIRRFIGSLHPGNPTAQQRWLNQIVMNTPACERNLDQLVDSRHIPHPFTRAEIKKAVLAVHAEMVVAPAAPGRHFTFDRPIPEDTAPKPDAGPAVTAAVDIPDNIPEPADLPTTVPSNGAGANGHAKCTVCGRPISDPASVARGAGEVCAGHGNGNGHAAGNGSAGSVPALGVHLYAPPPATETPAPALDPVALADIVDAWLDDRVEALDLADGKDARRYGLKAILEARNSSHNEAWRALRAYKNWPAEASTEDKLAGARAALKRLNGESIDRIERLDPPALLVSPEMPSGPTIFWVAPVNSAHRVEFGIQSPAAGRVYINGVALPVLLATLVDTLFLAAAEVEAAGCVSPLLDSAIEQAQTMLTAIQQATEQPA